MKKWVLFVTIYLIFHWLYAGEVKQQVLSNGLQVVVKESNYDQNVSVFCFVKTGAMMEGKLLGAGVSHYLEHVVSGGTTSKRTEEEYAALSSRIGAIENAYTTDRVTTFHMTANRAYVDTLLQVIGEHVQYCSFDPREVAREKEVILKEIVMSSSPAVAQLTQQMSERCYPLSNRRLPVIGYPEVFQTLTREQIQEYYHARYAPNNMVLVVVGNVEADSVMNSVTRVFGAYPRRSVEPVILPDQPPYEGRLEAVDEFEVELPTVCTSIIVPRANFSDAAAINAALDILAAKRQSLLQYELIEKQQLVNYLYAWYEGGGGDAEGTIRIMFEAKDPTKVREIIKQIDFLLQKAAKKGFTQKQINNLVQRQIASAYLKSKSTEDEADEIGWNMIDYGQPDMDIVQPNLTAKLKPENLDAVMRKYLLSENKFTFFGMPKGTSALLNQEVSKSQEESSLHKETLADGTTLFQKSNNHDPVVYGSLLVPVSSDYETMENVGTFELMIRQMIRSSSSYSSLDLSEWLEDNMISLTGTSGQDGFFIDFVCLKRDFPELCKRLQSMLSHPDFSNYELELAKQERQASYQRAISDAEIQQADFRARKLYPNQRDGVSQATLNEIIQKTTRDQLINDFKQWFKADSIYVALVGDITLKEAEEAVKGLRQAIPRGKVVGTKIPLYVAAIDSTFSQEYDFEQVNIDINYQAPTLLSSDYAAMAVLNSVLNSSKGRIHVATRGVNNLSYFAYSSYFANGDTGYLRITSQTSLEKKKLLISTLQNEIIKLQTTLVSKAEMEEAIMEDYNVTKTWLNDARLPNHLVWLEASGRGSDFLETNLQRQLQVTPEQLQSVAKKYLAHGAVIVSYPKPEVSRMVNDSE